MKRKFLVAVMILLASATLVMPIANADTLNKSDFLPESFSKIIDFMDYARAYAANNGLTPPPSSYHAYLDTDYVNTSGLQLFYAGLENITLGGSFAFRIPMQSFILHYKTSNQSRDVLLGSTFLMLMAFNESSNTIFPNSPDINDTLYASFSMGYDLSALNAILPLLNSNAEIIPLTNSNNGLQWTWGMKYTNLTALWWRTWIAPSNATYAQSWPVALTVYDELTFTYNLTVDASTQTATLTENHVIGRVRDLFVGTPLLWAHYNSTGEYWLGRKISNNIAYDYLEENSIKMSVVNFQTSIMADHETYSATSDGQNVTNTETSITNSSINTYSDDGEKISSLNFGSNNEYKLFNYTSDPTEENYTTNEARARTAKAGGFAEDKDLFSYQLGLMKFLPLIVASMCPRLYARAAETITNMTRANYFYIIGYGNYSGYRIEQDPTLAIYMATSTTARTQPLAAGAGIIIAVIAIVLIATAAFALHRRKPKPQETATASPPSLG